MWPFKKNKDRGIELLRVSESRMLEIVAYAFRYPGPLFDPHQEELIRSWLGNFKDNLSAAVSALENGTDMQGRSISSDQVFQGLRRMCDDYGKIGPMNRLEGVCGQGVRSRFELVIETVRLAVD